MAKMPHRRVLRGVVADAIFDREEFVDACCGDDAIVSTTKALIARYEAFLKRLGDTAPLTDDDRRLLSRATGHARIWRTGLLDSWINTTDRARIKEHRDDISRLESVERALGVTPSWAHGGPDPEGVRSVSIFEVAKRPDGLQQFTG